LARSSAGDREPKLFGDIEKVGNAVDEKFYQRDRAITIGRGRLQDNVAGDER